MNNVYCDVLFPTFVMYTENKELITEDILNKSKELIREYGKKPFYSPCYSTVSTMGSVLELDLFKDIKRAISNTIGAYCERVKIQTENLKFSGSWVNLYEQHGYQDLHTHADSVLSGVFYLKSAGEKDLIFQAPWHFFQPCQPEYIEQNLDNCHNVEYASVEGRCFIFPSHLMHRTLPATAERMSLSFNIVYR